MLGEVKIIDLLLFSNKIALKYILKNAMMTDIGRFMFGVGALIQYEETNEILIVKRAKDHSDFNREEWELVFGRMNNHEGIEAAVRREVFEELKLKDLEIIKAMRVWHFYRGEKLAEKEILGMTFWCRTGQREFELSPEHSEYRWVKPEEALKLIKVKGIQDDVKLFMERQNDFFIAMSGVDDRLLEV